MQSKVFSDYVEFYFPTKTHATRKISLYLKRWRLDRGYTQSQLARMSHCSGNSISSYENGEYFPTLISLMDLAWALRISVMDLFDCYRYLE